MSENVDILLAQNLNNYPNIYSIILNISDTQRELTFCGRELWIVTIFVVGDQKKFLQEAYNKKKITKKMFD